MTIIFMFMFINDGNIYENYKTYTVMGCSNSRVFSGTQKATEITENKQHYQNCNMSHSV